MKFKMYFLLIVLISLFFIITGCGKEAECIEQAKPNCICTMQYDPVCGCNDKTYGNTCMADCAGIVNYTKGKCN